MSTVMGVDAAAREWLAVLLVDGLFAGADLQPSVAALLDGHPEVEVVAVDIPMALGGHHTVLAVGNRQGWLTSKAPFEFFGFRASEFRVADDAARRREAKVGVVRYAGELGIPSPV